MRIQSINYTQLSNTHSFKSKKNETDDIAPIKNPIYISKEEAENILQKGDDVISSVQQVRQIARNNYNKALDIIATWQDFGEPDYIETAAKIANGTYKKDAQGELKEFSSTITTDKTQYHIEYKKGQPRRITIEYENNKKDVFLFDRKGMLTSAIFGTSTSQKDQTGRTDETDKVYGFWDDEILRNYTEKIKVSNQYGYENTSDTESKYEMSFRVGKNNKPYLSKCRTNRWTHYGYRISFDKYKEFKFDENRNLIC